jgi:hypothetical protein
VASLLSHKNLLASLIFFDVLDAFFLVFLPSASVEYAGSVRDAEARGPILLVAH